MTTLGWYGNNVAYYQLISSGTSVALVCIQSERNSCAKKWKTRAWDKSSSFLTSAQPTNHNIRSLFSGRFWVIITQSTQMFQSCYHLTCTEVKDHVHNFSLVCYHATLYWTQSAAEGDGNVISFTIRTAGSDYGARRKMRRCPKLIHPDHKCLNDNPFDGCQRHLTHKYHLHCEARGKFKSSFGNKIIMVDYSPLPDWGFMVQKWSAGYLYHKAGTGCGLANNEMRQKEFISNWKY